jgi:RNA polymerase sigma-70 factor (ECF subfamily)
MTPHDFTRLVNAHGPPLILYARQWSAAPEDVVQEAFLKLVTLHQPPREPVAWLYKVVRNAAIDAGRTTQHRRQRETAVARPVRWFVEREVDGLDAEVAVAALQRLPVEQREVVVARLWGGLSFEQIADVAGCSASTAFRRYEAGIDTLRRELRVPCPNPSPP